MTIHQYDGLLWRSLDPSDVTTVQNLGFTITQLAQGPYPDAVITRAQLETITENNWNYKPSYPPAVKLNCLIKSQSGR